MSFSTVLSDFIHIFLPRVCICCDEVLLTHEKELCTSCFYHLPLTDFHRDPQNETAQQLWAKLDFEHAMSMLYLAKSSRVERLIHKLKYADQPQIGEFLGICYGKILQDVDFVPKIDMICPVPIHKSKLRKRGYNQSVSFAKGLSSSMNVPWVDNLLIRTKATVSQTKKRRTERYENVEDVFELINPNHIAGKHILLVDDVLTTGATVCAAGNLFTAADARVSVVTIARA